MGVIAFLREMLSLRKRVWEDTEIFMWRIRCHGGRNEYCEELGLVRKHTSHSSMPVM